MCGVIGIIGKEPVATSLFLGMLNLQHRGQDSAGIVTYDSGFHERKTNGSVDQVFNEDNLKQLMGNMGVGHVRYPTVGKGIFPQPIIITYPYGIAMAHNGNVINYNKLKQELENNKWYITSDCDVEIILNIFSEELSKRDNSVNAIFESVKSVQERVTGAYSVITIIANQGLLAFKDPNSIKPLCFGKKENSYAFASESISLEFQGYEIIRELGPGEAVFIDKELNVHEKTIIQKEKHPCMFEWVYFARPESTIHNLAVYTARLRLGKELAKKLKGIKADLVMPVPDTSRTAAIALSEALNIPYREGLIKNRYISRTFIMKDQTQREKAVKMKLNPVKSEIEGKTIILMDDSIVRGTTSKKIVKLLKDNGAKVVYFAVSCPMIKHPCYYGIDFPLKTELIATNKTLNEIKKEIGADLVIYQNIESLKKCFGEEICTACLSGEYPTDINDAQNFEEMRENDRS